MKIRTARKDDLGQIVEIYNQAVEQKFATADLTPITVKDRIKWFEEHTSDKYPIYVAAMDNNVIGWYSISPYRPGRMALRYTAEVSYYIRREYRRMGVGSKLLEHAIAQSPQLEIKTLFALLLDVNRGSIQLLEKYGFEKWGCLPGIADFDGEECGHVIYGLRIY